jgi:photosystem II stability/assembly factor-like uncharacterized protein
MYKLTTLYTAFLCLALAACQHQASTSKKERPEAGRAFEFWNMGRMYPDGKLHTEKLTAAIAELRSNTAERGGPAAIWEDIGPKNIGGRTLCLAIHPQNPSILFMGAASGGLWKSTTNGIGVNAWQRIETGFPVIGVGAIAIDPSDPNIMYIGTGEVYNYENSAPNVVVRTTRGTYGIGILKTTDGGATWEKSLDVDYSDLVGVQEIKINPKRPQTVWATTTNGLLRSYDGGTHWTTVLERKMAVDLDMHPTDTSTLFVTFGSLDDEDISGIFRTTDGGANFTQLMSGLPITYSGKALLDIFQSNPNIIYTSVGNAFAQAGLFKSTDGGDNWQAASTADVCTYQGWYSHDIAIHPTDSDRLLWCGIDMWRSTNGGPTTNKITQWFNWDFGQVPVGGPEGPGDYIHADIHHIYYHPTDPNLVYCVTDGGLFASKDGGIKWEGRNGNYQTQQFYANFGNSTTNPLWAIGGMQDNATAIYTGDPAWIRVIGGDGGCSAVHPLVDDIMYASSQNGNFYFSGNGGNSWGNLPPLPGTSSAFIAPFELAPTNPDIMYAGKDILSRLDLGLNVWEELTSSGGVIVTIGVSNNNENDVYFSRAMKDNIGPKVFHLDANTENVVEMSGLPDRLCTDIARSPSDDNTVYATFSGFGTAHLYKTTNGGTTWTPISGLPDVPTNSVLIDPVAESNIYVANDIGVWFSMDGGFSWEYLSEAAPQAMLAMHLSISADRKLRVATHGLGVWQTPMKFTVGTNDATFASNMLNISPNPATDHIRIKWSGTKDIVAQVSVFDLSGRCVISNSNMLLSNSNAPILTLGTWSKGIYLLVVNDTKTKQQITKKIVLQ